MTAIEERPICPQCGGATSVPLSGDVRLCLVPDCRHEWNPADVTAPAPAADDATLAREVAAASGVPEAVIAKALASHPDDILGPPASELAAIEAQAALDALVGTDVVLEGGQRATVVSFPDDDHVTVLLRYDDDHDELATVAFNDVVRAVTPAPVEIDIADDDARKLAAVNMLVAGLALNAALATLEGDTPDYVLAMPPSGWLPDDASSLPIIEQGVAYAIASLVVSFGIPRATLAAVAAQFVSDSQDPTTKGEPT